MYRVAAILAFLAVAGSSAAGQDCGEACNVIPKSAPSAEVRACVAKNMQLYDLTVQLAARVKVLETAAGEAAAAGGEAQQDQAASPPVKKVAKKKRSNKGCKPGRTRNAQGKCGRWR